MNLGNAAANYAGRKAVDAAFNIKERTQESLGAGTFGQIVLLVLVVGSLFIPADWFFGFAWAVLPFVFLAVFWLTGSIAVRVKEKVKPDLKRTLAHSHGTMLLFGVTIVVLALRALFPAAVVLWVIVSVILTVLAMVLGGGAALAGVAEAKAEVAREERLVLRVATALGIRSNAMLERWHEGEVDMTDTYDGGIQVALPEEFWHTLIDEGKVIASFATFLPEFELGEDDIEPSQGMFVLHPVSTDTHAGRQNLRENKVTSEAVEFDFGDDADKAKRVDFGGADLGGGTDNFGI